MEEESLSWGVESGEGTGWLGGGGWGGEGKGKSREMIEEGLRVVWRIWGQ